MNNQTFETLQKTKIRFETCLEVDKSLSESQQGELRDIIELIDRMLDEVTGQEHST